MTFKRDKLNYNVYFEDVFIRPKEVVKRIVTAIKTNYPKCNGIVSASGVSGASMVVPVAMELDLPFGFVRTKSSHSKLGRIDGHIDLYNPVIIDDFISSGATMRKTVRYLMQHERALTPLGIVCYGCYAKDNVKYNQKTWSANMAVFGKRQKVSVPLTSIVLA